MFTMELCLSLSVEVLEIGVMATFTMQLLNIVYFIISSFFNNFELDTHYEGEPVCSFHIKYWCVP